MRCLQGAALLRLSAASARSCRLARGCWHQKPLLPAPDQPSHAPAHTQKQVAGEPECGDAESDEECLLEKMKEEIQVPLGGCQQEGGPASSFCWEGTPAISDAVAGRSGENAPHICCLPRTAPQEERLGLDVTPVETGQLA